MDSTRVKKPNDPGTHLYFADRIFGTCTAFRPAVFPVDRGLRWPFLRRRLCTFGAMSCFTKPRVRALVFSLLYDLEEANESPSAGCFTGASRHQIGRAHI